MDVTLAWRQTSGTVLYRRGVEMITWSWNSRPLEHPCREKGRGEAGETAPLMLSAFLETKKEVAQQSCICHFWDARDSVFCNCHFDLCLPDHKQAPYQSHPKGKKWSQELDTCTSALIVSKTSASMQSSQRLRCFCLRQLRISTLISELSSLFQPRT